MDEALVARLLPNLTPPPVPNAVDMVLQREPEPTIRAGQMQCLSLKLVQESRTLIMEEAEFVRSVDEECETGASNGLVFRVKTKDLPPLYLYLRLLCTRPGATSVVKRCQVPSCAIFANSAGILQVRPQPPYAAVSLPMSKELVLIMRVAEHTGHHATPDDSFFRFQLAILNSTSLNSTKVTAGFVSYSGVPRKIERDRTAKNLRLFVSFLRRLVKPIDKDGGSIREPNSPLRQALLEHLAKVEGILSTQNRRLTVRVQVGESLVSEETTVTALVHELSRTQPATLKERDLTGRTLLHYAALMGYDGLATFLLERNKELGEISDFNGLTALHIAVEEGNKEVISTLVQADVPLLATDDAGETAMDYALREGIAGVSDLLTVRDNVKTTEAEFSAELNMLFEAAHANDVALLKELLAKPLSANTVEPEKSTPIFAAAAAGSLEAAQVLLAEGADLRRRDGMGATPLHVAALHGQEALVEWLLDHNADPNAEDIHGSTPLHAGAYSGSAAIVESILKRGAKTGAREKKTGATPLLIACFKNRLEVISLLLDATGIDVNARDNSGVCALHHLAFQGHNDLVERILQLKPAVNTLDNKALTPLHMAAQNGKQKIVLMLLAAGAEVNSSKYVTYTPLHCAAQFGHSEVVAALLSGKADPAALDDTKATPLHKAAFGGHKDAVVLLLGATAQVNATDSQGSTPLHSACFGGHIECVTLLLRAKADVEAKDLEECTALHLAAFFGHLEVVELLLGEGKANVSPCDVQGASPLHQAVLNGHKAIGLALLSKGAKLAVLNKQQHTPLHLAVHHVDCCAFLLEKGAIIDARDNEGKTPLHHAVAGGLEDTIRLLVLKGAKLDVKDGTGRTVQEVADETHHAEELQKALKVRDAGGKAENNPQLIEQAIKKFNVHPGKGLDFLISSGYRNTPKDVAKFLLTSEGLKKEKIGEWLGEKVDFNLQTLAAFVEEFQFIGVDFDAALRAFLSKLRLPGEAQKIDRMMERFAGKYCACNPGLFVHGDAAYLLAFSLIMLNTDLHNPSIKNKMTKAQFIKNSQFNEESALPKELLEKMYDSIASNEIKMDDNSMFSSSEKKGFLTKQGGRVKTWKKRWFVLSNNCLYYFKKKEDEDKDKPCGYIPLENLDVKELPKGPRKHCFEIFNPAANELKACKIGDGSFEKGHHESYMLSADNAQEMVDWVRAIRSNVVVNPYKQLMELAKQKSKKAKKDKKGETADTTSGAKEKEKEKEKETEKEKEKEKEKEAALAKEKEKEKEKEKRKTFEVDFELLHSLSLLCSEAYRNQKALKDQYGALAIVGGQKNNINCLTIFDNEKRLQKIVLSGTWKTSIHLRDALTNKKQGMRTLHQLDDTAKHFASSLSKHIKKENPPLIIAGHALGGSVAMLLANLLEGYVGTIVTFGAPKVLRPDEAEGMKDTDTQVMRVTVHNDPITWLFLGAAPVGYEITLLKEKYYTVSPGPGEEKDREPPPPPIGDVEKRYPHNHIDGYSKQLEAKKNMLGGLVDYAARGQYVA